MVSFNDIYKKKKGSIQIVRKLKADISLNIYSSRGAAGSRAHVSTSTAGAANNDCSSSRSVRISMNISDSLTATAEDRQNNSQNDEEQ